jgi:hypothetical protein
VNQACAVGVAGTVVGGSKQSALVQRNSGQTGTRTLVFAQALTTDQLIPLRGKIVSISGWLIAGNNFRPTSGTVTLKLYAGTGTEGKRGGGFTGETLVASGSINLTPGASSGSQIFATSGSVFPNNATQAEFRYEWTPTGTAGALDYVAFQRCMLFAGNLNLAFDPTRFADELARCQRYYWKTFSYATAPVQNAGSLGSLFIVQATGAATNFVLASWTLPTRMRVPGSGTLYNPAAPNAQAHNQTVGADCSSTTVNADEASFRIFATSAAGSAAGNANHVHLTLDADL